MKKKRLFLILVLLLFVLLIIVPFIIAIIAYEANFGHRVSASTESTTLSFETDTMRRKEIEFPSNQNQILRGYLYSSDSIPNPKALIVFSHGYLGTHLDYLNQIHFFVKNGYLVLGYDNTGSGMSDGKNLIGLAQSPLDLDAALTFVEKNPALTSYPLLLYGHSWGGYAVTAVLNYNHSIAGVVSRSGFSNSRDMLVEYGSNLYGNEIQVLSPYVYVYEKMKFGKSVDLNGIKGINHSTCPILLLHSKDDEVISLKNSLLIHQDKYVHPERIETILYENKTHDVVKSDSCLVYEKQQKQLLNQLIQQYGSKDKIPKEVLQKQIQDQDLINELDSNVMNSILTFYEKCIIQS